MNTKQHKQERTALVATLAVALLTWAYLVAVVGSKLATPTII